MSQPKGVTALLASMRPHLIAPAIRMIRAQTVADIELLVLLHRIPPGSLPPEARAALATADRVIEAPADWTVARLRDAGMATGQRPYLAIFDDDDLYGPGYLAEAVAALQAGKGTLVGKSELYVYVERHRELVLWRPGSSSSEQDYVMTGTLVLPRDLGVRFAEGDHKMHAFLERVRAAGHRIYATSRRSYVYRRHAAAEHHTWHLPDLDRFRREGIVVRRDLANDPATLLALVT